ncbi:MAG: polysaccharide deacetylase family protein [Clostridia bacterium]|nr:polysaccharide deacetylase family protein [Clostridia bacterium]
MKIFVFKARTLGFAAAALILTILLAVLTVVIFTSGTISVFGTDKDLPIYSVDLSEKKVAITFDCAWGADDIPDILGTLEREGIKATFFIVGQWAEKYPEAVKMIAEKGHDVANHGYSHLRMGALDKGKLKSEILDCSKVLNELTGNDINLMRPPYGDYSNQVIATARELGYYTIQWDVDSLDWKPGISQQEITNRVVQKVKTGSVILFHNDTPHTAKVLPSIIQYLKNDGYGFLPVSGMILRENYYIDFEGRQKPKDKEFKQN